MDIISNVRKMYKDTNYNVCVLYTSYDIYKQMIKENLITNYLDYQLIDNIIIEPLYLPNQYMVMDKVEDKKIIKTILIRTAEIRDQKINSILNGSV